jgi:hypothetical protein
MQDYGTYKIVTQEDRRKLFSLLQARSRAERAPAWRNQGGGDPGSSAAERAVGDSQRAQSAGCCRRAL